MVDQKGPETPAQQPPKQSADIIGLPPASPAIETPTPPSAKKSLPFPLNIIFRRSPKSPSESPAPATSPTAEPVIASVARSPLTHAPTEPPALPSTPSATEQPSVITNEVKQSPAEPGTTDISPLFSRGDIANATERAGELFRQLTSPYKGPGAVGLLDQLFTVGPDGKLVPNSPKINEMAGQIRQRLREGFNAAKTTPEANPPATPSPLSEIQTNIANLIQEGTLYARFPEKVPDAVGKFAKTYAELLQEHPDLAAINPDIFRTVVSIMDAMPKDKLTQLSPIDNTIGVDAWNKLLNLEWYKKLPQGTLSAWQETFLNDLAKKGYTPQQLANMRQVLGFTNYLAGIVLKTPSLEPPQKPPTQD